MVDIFNRLTGNSKEFNACNRSNFHTSDKIGNNVFNFKYLDLKIKQNKIIEDSETWIETTILWSYFWWIFFPVFSIKSIQILCSGILNFCPQPTPNLLSCHRKIYIDLHGDYMQITICEGAIPGSIPGALFKVSASSGCNCYKKKGFSINSSSKYLQKCFSISQQYVQFPTYCQSTVNVKQENF